MLISAVNISIIGKEVKRKGVKMENKSKIEAILAV